VPAFELSPSLLSEAASPHCGWSFLKPFQVRKLLTSSPTKMNCRKGSYKPEAKYTVAFEFLGILRYVALVEAFYLGWPSHTLGVHV